MCRANAGSSLLPQFFVPGRLVASTEKHNWCYPFHRYEPVLFQARVTSLGTIWVQGSGASAEFREQPPTPEQNHVSKQIPIAVSASSRLCWKP